MKVIFEDTHLIVLSKPAGLLSQGDVSGDADLVSLLREHFGRNYVGLVHRLDRNTTGLMVVAKRSKAAERLSTALQKGDLKRYYKAWIFGYLNGKHRWQHWLYKDEENNTVRSVTEESPGAKKCVLVANGLEARLFHGRPISLAHFELETGRSHQIRVQSAKEGYPLLGDRKYGGTALPADFADFPRPALHSYKIEFPHPMSREVLTFEEALPDDMESLRKGTLYEGP